jgi:hypothetical protein
MPALHVAWRSAGPTGNSPVLSQGQPGLLVSRATLAATASANGPLCLEAALDPLALTVSASASAGVSHWLRLADASLRPLPAESGPLVLARGDSYVALVSRAPEPDTALNMAAARFIHLRDYFNADKLASALLLELQDGQPTGPGLGVLVVECR